MAATGAKSITATRPVDLPEALAAILLTVSLDLYALQPQLGTTA